ncbi:MAG: alpha/beta fold hydrolase, partial [Nocardiopsaceae bacterium]|nr:alpha/beta fold hydrolase [Nocardiopsaceae bacterium]
RAAGAAAWPVSGKLRSGLAAQARALREYLDAHPELDVLDVGWSLAATRSRLSHRAVVIGAGRDELLAGLDAVIAGKPADGVVLDSGARADSVAFVLPAPDGQSLEPARALLATEPVFAARLRECAEALGTDPLAAEPATEQTTAQTTAPATALAAVQIGLAALWGAYGVEPDAVVAEPGAEPVADAITGRRSLSDALRAVAETGAPGSGGSLKERVWARAEQGVRAFLELSPEPSLADTVTAAIDSAGRDPGEFVVTRATDFRRMAAEAFTGGVRVDWSPANRGGHRVPLPTYRFQRQRYWPDPEEPATPAPRAEKPADSRRGGAFTVLLRRAHVEQAIGDAVPIITAASKFRPSFSSVGELPPGPRSKLASDGAAAPVVVCVPSFLAGSGPHQFARLATAFQPRLKVAALTLPGFDRDAPLPGSWAVAVEAMAEATLAAAGDDPFVLTGHSVGGLMAQAVAGRLEQRGRPARGVAMIDTYDIDDPGDREALFIWAMGEILDRDPTGLVVNDDNLMSMGAYLRLYEEWVPVSITAPTLAVRTAGDGGGAASTPIEPTWKAADATESVTADHFSILEAHAPRTARILTGWFSGLL